jgi:hypothetical protein
MQTNKPATPWTQTFPSPLAYFCIPLFKKTLEKTGPTSTFARFCTSEHLQDLQWIVSIALIVWGMFTSLIFIFACTQSLRVSFELLIYIALALVPLARFLVFVSSHFRGFTSGAFATAIIVITGMLLLDFYPLHNLAFWLGIPGRGIASWLPKEIASWLASPVREISSLLATPHWFFEQWRDFLRDKLQHALAGKAALHTRLKSSWTDNYQLLSTLAAVMAVTLNWAYQNGSHRLGAIDLFGCEISAICRTCLVADFAKLTVGGFNKSEEEFTKKLFPIQTSNNPAPKERKPFTSEENYTPVYDGNVSDLQPLDAGVVTSVTEFYTYRKTMMDYLRKIAGEQTGTYEHLRLTLQMIYVQYLMYESGRKAVERLFEFEPNRAESRINIFCSELIVYGFLVKTYQALNKKEAGTGEFALDRLGMRKANYRLDVPVQYYVAKRKDDDAHWERARLTIEEMKKCYFEAFSVKEWPTEEDLVADNKLAKATPRKSSRLRWEGAWIVGQARIGGGTFGKVGMTNGMEVRRSQTAAPVRG